MTRDTDISELNDVDRFSASESEPESLVDRIRRIWREEGGPELDWQPAVSYGRPSAEATCHPIAGHLTFGESDSPKQVRHTLRLYAFAFIRHHWAAGGGPKLKRVNVERGTREWNASVKYESGGCGIGDIVTKWDGERLQKFARYVSGIEVPPSTPIRPRDSEQSLLDALKDGKRPHGKEPCRCYICIQTEAGPRTEHSARVKLDYGARVARAVAIGCQTWGLLMSRDCCSESTNADRVGKQNINDYAV